ncbi:MAG: aldolase [Methanosarcinales archaeon]|nr:MAG: aldolase [Methanosarcinales archaeon]
MWQEISRFGKKLVEYGLVESHFGNISIRTGDTMLITRSGSALDEIDQDAVVEVGIAGSSSMDLIASSETIVHRAIYQNTSALAIIHAHCPYAVIESLIADSPIVPVDSEGVYFLHEIPVVTGGIGTSDLARNAAPLLREHKGVIIQGHGTIAVGMVLEEAYVVTSQIEHCCQVKYHVDLFNRVSECWKGEMGKTNVDSGR